MRTSMSEQYYTHITFEEDGETKYIYMDTAKPFDDMLRVSPEPPQGDSKTTEPYYLEPCVFWDKVSDMYIDSR